MEFYFWITGIYMVYVARIHTNPRRPGDSVIDGAGGDLVLFFFGWLTWPLAAIAHYKIWKSRRTVDRT